ncbi:MAG: hypothetical protein ACLFNB_04885, partial [Candidatus Woesearchaeota archaeon]
MNGAKKSSQECKATLAYVSPMPPSRSGVADYSVNLVKRLQKEFRVNVYSQESAIHHNKDLSIRT